jgi:hypothetical protein
MANDEEMDPKFRGRRLQNIKRLIDQIPSAAIPALENYVSDLLPEVEDEMDPMDNEVAAELMLMDAPPITEKKQ